MQIILNLRQLASVILILIVLGQGITRAGTLAQFRTVFGDIDVELYDQDKPVTVQNFIRYVQSGRYQNEFSHRLVPGFVLQGGGFALTNRATTNAMIIPVATFPPIVNEFSVGQRLSNVFGTIAMAKLGGNTNSATSQWYFNLANNSFLDAADTNNLFVVFGKVVRGTNVLNVFNTFQNYNGTQTSNLVANVDSLLNFAYYPNFASCPLLRPVLSESNLIFLDITLLNVRVTLKAGGVREISWNSVSNRVNHVEYTANFPPAWNSLVATNGNGNQIKVLDTNTVNDVRFYRVRVAY